MSAPGAPSVRCLGLGSLLAGSCLHTGRRVVLVAVTVGNGAAALVAMLDSRMAASDAALSGAVDPPRGRPGHRANTPQQRLPVRSLLCTMLSPSDARRSGWRLFGVRIPRSPERGTTRSDSARSARRENGAGARARMHAPCQPYSMRVLPHPAPSSQSGRSQPNTMSTTARLCGRSK